MKTEKWLTALTSALLTFAIAYGGLGCMVTAFPLNGDLKILALTCGICALVICLCGAFGKMQFLLIPPLLLLLIPASYLPWEKLVLAFEAVINRISYIYNLAYDCGYFAWDGADYTQVDVTPALQVLGALICLVSGWVISCRQSALVALPTSIVPLFLCLVVTDTVPKVPYLFLLLLGLILLLLTQSVRRRSPGDGNRLTGILALPVAAAIGLLFFAIPQEGYTGQQRANEWTACLMDWVEGFTGSESGTQSLSVSYGGGSARQVDLAQIGPQVRLEYPVLGVRASYEGSVYLRGCSYDTYNGKRWVQTETAENPALWPSQGSMLTVGSLTVETRTRHANIYLPYYPKDQDWSALTGGRLENTGELTVYDYIVTQPAPRNSSGFSSEKGSEELLAALAPYLQLPESTRSGAQAILAEAGIGESSNPEDTVWQIAEFVRTSATYDLHTRRMPAEEDDFVLWFLVESDTGYCVHFASAAVVLLRAAGIPARYVTGYMTSTEGAQQSNLGYSVTVTGGDAHAWVEYWTQEAGWQMLEVTPPEETEDPAPEVTETTSAPTETQAPEVTQPSLPPEPTRGETAPGPEQPGEAEPELDLRWLIPVLEVLAGAAALAGLVWGQWKLRLALLRRRLTGGTPNRQALARWRETERLCRILKRQPPDELLALAEKAKYSQHTLSEAELARFDEVLDALRTDICQLPLPGRLLYRLVYAVC